MIKNHNYKINSDIVYMCRYHIVWCSKYRRKVLTGKVGLRLEQIVKKVAAELNVDISSIKISEDNIYIHADIDPKKGVMNFVNKAKRRSSNMLVDEFHFLKTKLPTLWNRSALIATEGDFSIASSNKFIEMQQTSEREKEKNKWKEYKNEICRSMNGTGVEDEVDNG